MNPKDPEEFADEIFKVLFGDPSSVHTRVRNRVITAIRDRDFQITTSINEVLGGTV